MRQLLCAFAALAFGAAHAEEAAAPAPSPAQAIISAASAEGVFTAVEGRPASARHLGSGLLCRFQADGQGGRIFIFPGLPRGDDIACEFADGGGINIRLHATRLPERASLGEVVAAAEAALRRAAPQASVRGAPIEMPASTAAPAWRRLEYTVPGEAGASDYLGLYVAQRGAWTFKMRVRAPAPDDAALGRMQERAELMWRGALADIATR